MNGNWLIYGAYGYTGELIVQEAVRRGLHPVIAGRNAEKLAVLAAQFQLETRKCMSVTYALLRNMKMHVCHLCSIWKH